MVDLSKIYRTRSGAAVILRQISLSAVDGKDPFPIKGTVVTQPKSFIHLSWTLEGLRKLSGEPDDMDLVSAGGSTDLQPVT